MALNGHQDYHKPPFLAEYLITASATSTLAWILGRSSPVTSRVNQSTVAKSQSDYYLHCGQLLDL